MKFNLAAAFSSKFLSIKSGLQGLLKIAKYVFEQP